MGNTYLDAQELFELTDKTRSKAQVRALKFMGIEHKVRADGKAVVLWAHINKEFGGLEIAKSNKQKKASPNWEAI